MGKSGPIVWDAITGKPASPWIWTPRQDLAWIAGGASLAFGASAVAATLAWPALSPLLVAAFLHLAVLCNYPHYAATYQLIYRERAKSPTNWRWLLGTIPLAVLAVIAAAAAPRVFLGPLVRVYLTWSAYHYAAQHFGIASMYAGRGGRPFDAVEKRLVQIGFVAVGAHMMIITNTVDGIGAVAFGQRAASSLALLPAWMYWVGIASAMLGFASFVTADRRIAARTGRGLDRAAWLLFATNAAWFVLPYLRAPGANGPWMTPSIAAWAPYAVPFFHCAQYLGVTSWRARTTGPVKPIYLFMALVFLGLALFEGITAGLPFVAPVDGAQALLIVPAVLNIHHFVIDGIMWKRPKKAAAPVAVSERAAAPSSAPARP